MEQLKSLIESSSGLGAFDALLKTLADALNVSVQQIQQNLPMYLDEYARYAFVGQLGWAIFTGVILGALAALVVGLVASIASDAFEFRRKTITIFTLSSGGIAFIIAFLLPIVVEVVLLNTSPTIYGITQLIRLLE